MGEELKYTPEEEKLTDDRHGEMAEAIKGGARINEKNELVYTAEQIEKIREDNKEQIRTLEDIRQEVSEIDNEIQRLIGFREHLSKSTEDAIRNKGVFYGGSTEHWEDRSVLRDIQKRITALGNRSDILRPILYEKADIVRK